MLREVGAWSSSSCIRFFGGGLGGLGGGGFGSPIRRGTAAAAEKLATGKRAGAFPTPLSTPWRKRLRSADAVAI